MTSKDYNIVREENQTRSSSRKWNRKKLDQTKHKVKKSEQLKGNLRYKILNKEDSRIQED